MKIDIAIWRKIKITALVLFVLSGVVMAEYSYRTMLCESIVVTIDNQSDEGFLTKSDIVEEIQSVHIDDVTNLKLIHIDAEQVENQVKNNIFVRDAEVLKNHKGQLCVSMIQEVPVLRMLTENNSSYVAQSGHKLPLSLHHTARVLMLRCSENDSLFVGNESKVEFESDLLSLISFIDKDEFLKAQICEIWIGEDGELTLYPQITKTKILLASRPKNEHRIVDS